MAGKSVQAWTLVKRLLERHGMQVSAHSSQNEAFAAMERLSRTLVAGSA